MIRNLVIREAAERAGVHLWQIADKLGIHDSNFSRKLRHELPSAETEKILKIISTISEENANAETSAEK